VGVIYRGFLANGYVFNPATAQPVTFTLAQTVPGFRDGLLGARGNSRRLLIVPPSQGYGNRTAGNNKIPAGSVLLFDVNISSVTTPPPPATTRAPR
jgi:peptidylprolyl isomerase